MSGKPRIYGKTANFGRSVRDGMVVVDGEVSADDSTVWPPDIRDSRTWLAEAKETTLNVYWGRLQRCGLNTFSQAARPSHRGPKGHDEVWVIQRWKVGVYLAFQARRVAGALGPWWVGGKPVMHRLVALPAGPERVRTAAALCAFVELAPGSEPGNVFDAARANDFLRRLR